MDINEAGMSKILDDNGDIGREDFIKFSQDSKLLDFGNLMGEVGVKTLATYPYAIKNLSERKEMPLVGGFGCLELVLYGIRGLAEQHYEPSEQ